MKPRNILYSLLLFSLIFGTVTPVVVQAREAHANSSSVEIIAPSSSSSAVGTTDKEKPSTEPSVSNIPAETREARMADDLRSPLIPESIIGEDEQEKVEDTAVFPYSAVVFLAIHFANADVHGTGVMIAPDLVLTAAHNIYNRQSKSWAEQVVAIPGRNGKDVQPYGSYEVAHYYILRDYKEAASEGDSFNHDIAVLKLSNPVPEAVGFLSVASSFSENERVQIPGYPGYTRTKMFYMHTAHGHLNGLDGKMIYHLVDTEGGNSGSPILNNQNQLVGIHTGGDYTIRPHGTQNAGRRIDQAVQEMIDLARSKGRETATIEVFPPLPEPTETIYRLYNATTKQYFYTRSLDEANVITQRGYRFEGQGFITAPSGQPIYRFYHAGRKAYVYTTNEGERQTIVNTGWKYEGIAWYSAGSKKVHRLFHPTAKVHMYTTSDNEVALQKSRGWKHEGIAFYTLN